VMKEIFNAAQCWYPGSTGSIMLENLFTIDKKLIGENILIYEKEPHPKDPRRTIERTTPNPYNYFLSQPAHSP
jgi:hypothetical protein